MALKKTKFAAQKKVDVHHLKENAHMYPEVYAALESLGLLQFVTYSHPFNEDLVMQFYAIVFFERNDTRSLTWMYGTSKYTPPFRKFSKIIPYEFYLEEQPEFARVTQITLAKEDTAFAYRPEEPFEIGFA